jgi:putative flippase GtrA
MSRSGTASVASHFAMRKTWSFNQSRSNRWRDIFRRSWEKNWGLLLRRFTRGRPEFNRHVLVHRISVIEISHFFSWHLFITPITSRYDIGTL